MSAFDPALLVAVVTVTVASFSAGWWLGRRRSAAHVRSLRTELQATYARAQRERTSLREQYEAGLRQLAAAAISTVRGWPPHD